MEMNKINRAADLLYKSRIYIKKIAELPQNCAPQNKKEAYAIQDSLVQKYLLSDNKISVIGKKIGCTNKAAQKQININEPVYGNIFSNYSRKSSCVLSAEDFFTPFIEPEFSFKIKKEITFSKAPYSFDEVYQSIDSVLPSIEIVDSRFNDWTVIGINNLIADNAANAYWIYGEEINNLDSFNFSDHLVTVYINDKIIDKGNANNVLDNPINSLTWLLNTLAIQNKPLPKDSYISTGTCTPALPINIGDNICADFGKLGKVNFNFI